MPLHPCFNPLLGQPATSRHPHPQARPCFPTPHLSVPGSHPGLSSGPVFPSLAYSGIPFQLFIFTNWRSSPAAPQYATPHKRFLEKCTPPRPSHSRQEGKGSAGRRSRFPSAPRLSSADRAGWAGPRAGQAGRGRGAKEGAVSGSRRGWRCPRARVPIRPGPRRGQTPDVAKSPPPHLLLHRARALSAWQGQPRKQKGGGLWRSEEH